MSAPARIRTLYEYVQGLPEGYTGEIVRGQLHVNPRPAGPHIRVGSKLGSRIETRFDEGEGGPGGWWILDEPELHFVRDVEIAVPDIAGWRRERMQTFPEDQRFEIVPDWVCEILSPRTAEFDRGEKANTYLHYGVAFYWIVDPKARTVEALAARDGAWRDVGSCSGDTPIRLPPFDAVALPPPWS